MPLTVERRPWDDVIAAIGRLARSPGWFASGTSGPTAADRPGASLLGRLTAGLGCLVLIGWAGDIPALKSLLPGIGAIKANTARSFSLPVAGPDRPSDQPSAEPSARRTPDLVAPA